MRYILYLITISVCCNGAGAEDSAYENAAPRPTPTAKVTAETEPSPTTEAYIQERGKSFSKYYKELKARRGKRLSADEKKELRDKSFEKTDRLHNDSVMEALGAAKPKAKPGASTGEIEDESDSSEGIRPGGATRVDFTNPGR